MDKRVWIGIDPGAKGSICALLPSEGKAIFKDPTDKPLEILEWLYQLKEQEGIRVIMVEDVHSIFGMSAKSNFSFGYNVGTVNTLAMATGETVDRVAPKKWQKEIGVKSKGKAIKQEVAQICDRLYPNVCIRGPKGGLLDGKSDALMLAHYAYLKYS